MGKQEYFDNVMQACKDWVFWCKTQNEAGKELDKLAKPLYNISMAYLELLKEYKGEEVWEEGDAQKSAERLVAKMKDKLEKNKA